MRSGGPHVADARFGADCFNFLTEVYEFLWCHSWVVVRGCTSTIDFFVEECAFVVIPRWIAVDNVVFVCEGFGLLWFGLIYFEWEGELHRMTVLYKVVVSDSRYVRCV